tara:strand:+ start:826 stop:1158 length:333 start_codon:yes stop_codon:yes gene_type:complete
MSVTFKEELKDIMVKQVNGLTDVIVEVNWVLTATHSDGRVKENNQVIILDPPDSTTFTEYSSLTKDEVRGWVRNFIPDDIIENRKNAIIDVFNEGILIQATSKSAPWEND